MPAAPQNPQTASTARQGTKFLAWVGDTDGGAPTEEQEDPTFRVLTVSRSAGGRQIDYALLAVDLGRREERLVDMETPTAWNRQVEIRIPGETDSSPVFWGMLGSQSLSLDERDESATVTARLDRNAYGAPLIGMRVRNPSGGAMVAIEMDPVFNPLVDGEIWSNRSTHKDPTGQFYVWVHPEAVQSTQAEAYQGETARQSWTLADMVFTLCWLLNPSETHIKNPTTEELQSAFTDAPEVSNFWIRRGQYLPQYLDAILTPHGYGWFTRFGTDGDGNTVRKIAFFRRGAGTEKEVFFQRPNDDTPPDLDLSKTNLKRLSHDLSVADLANRVYGYGAYEEREVTIELFRGWPEADDSLFPEELDRTDPESQYLNHPDAWRTWIANEGGDWNGTRPEITAPPDLASVFTLLTARRRRLEDCLQTDNSGRRIPPVAEWYDPADQTEGDPEVWKAIPPGSYSVLTDQIGIRFNGAQPPDDIATGGAGVRVRITGTVTGDKRLNRDADRRDESPNGQDVILFLDVSNRFFDRQVRIFGTYGSVLVGRFLTYPDERDDGDALQTYVESARNVEDAANLRASITLHGIHREYEIGDLITRVAGRNISFNRLSKDAEEKRYLQVIGIEWDTQRQETTLRVAVNEDEGYERDGTFGGPTGKKLRITQ